MLKFYLLLIIFSITSCSTIQKNKLERTRKYNDYSYGMFTGNKPIIWGTTESNKMIKRTKYNKPFFTLVSHFAGQLWPTSCGPASARIVLSAIYAKTNTPFPIDEDYSLYKDKNGMDFGKFIMSEKNVFSVYKGNDEELDYDIITRQKKCSHGLCKGKFCGGINIDKLTKIINMHQQVKATFVEVKPREINKIYIDNFRDIVKQIMLSDHKYMIANFHVGVVLPYTSGHFSPIAAYDDLTDTVLIMDVASYNINWSWIKIEELYKAMNSALNGVKRGYIIIEEVEDIKKEDKNLK